MGIRKFWLFAVEQGAQSAEAQRVSGLDASDGRVGEQTLEAGVVWV